MVEFLTARGTISAIENIISEANTLLFLVSPYLQPPKVLLDKLQDASSRHVSIVIIYRKGEVKVETLEQLRRLGNLSLCCCENLHAKCYFNEKAMVITSMNFVEASEKNWEIGMLLKKAEDEKVFTEAVKEIISLWKSSVRELSSQGVPPYRGKRQVSGYCIRCSKPIPLDSSRPHCTECYYEWEFWGNPNYPEKVCHVCGKSAEVTRLYPRCESCYRKSRR